MKFNLNRFQTNLLNSQVLCVIDYVEDLWSNKKQLGWVQKDDSRYKIVIANDIREFSKILVLIHELAHIVENHIELNFEQEFIFIRELFKNCKVDYSKISKIGGLRLFLNSALDLQVNSKYLTISNIEFLEEEGLKLATLDHYGFEYKENFRDYYIPLIEYIDNLKENNTTNSMSDIYQNIKLDFDDYLTNNLTEDEFNEISDYLDNFEFDYIEDSKNTKDLQDLIKSLIGVSNKSETEIFENIEKTHDKEIVNFLKSILKTTQKTRIDNLKIYNRNCRPENDLLYSSRKRNVEKSNIKLGIILDTSGSMKLDDILTALGSLSKSKNFINANTTIFQTNACIKSIFKITDITDNFSLESGGGTDLRVGVREAVKQGFNHIVIYSDFETFNLDEVLKESSAKFYAISTNKSSGERLSKKFLDNCVNYIWLEDN